MQINNLLLSLAIPAAAKTLDAAIGVIGNLSEGFSRTLAGSPAIGEANKEKTVPGLEQFADDLHDFLRSKGISGRYKLRFDVTSTGDTRSAASGVDAEKVVEQISRNPSWLRELRSIAVQLQAARTSPTSGQPPHVNIEISDVGASYWSAL